MDEAKILREVPRGVWGPIVWDHLYVLILANRDRDIPAGVWVNYLQQLAYMLPCAECRDHFRGRVALFQAQAIRSSDEAFPRGALSSWLQETHNEVNVRLKKPKAEWNASEAQEAFQRRVIGRVLAAATNENPPRLRVCTEGPAPASCGCATAGSGTSDGGRQQS